MNDISLIIYLVGSCSVFSYALSSASTDSYNTIGKTGILICALCYATLSWGGLFLAIGFDIKEIKSKLNKKQEE